MSYTLTDDEAETVGLALSLVRENDFPREEQDTLREARQAMSGFDPEGVEQ